MRFSSRGERRSLFILAVFIVVGVLVWLADLLNWIDVGVPG